MRIKGEMKAEERIYRNSETSEKAMEKRLVAQAKLGGCIPVKMTDPMQSGLPDRLIVLPDGKVMWVELKSEGKKPTALQEARIKELKELGHEVYVVSSKPELEMVVSMVRYLGS